MKTKLKADTSGRRSIHNLPWPQTCGFRVVGREGHHWGLGNRTPLPVWTSVPLVDIQEVGLGNPCEPLKIDMHVVKSSLISMIFQK